MGRFNKPSFITRKNFEYSCTNGYFGVLVGELARLFSWIPNLEDWGHVTYGANALCVRSLVPRQALRDGI